ncbi:MAG: hypothetical protein QW751_01565 [Candidatus Aenigmatarchaeota archaeon]|nr:hypothetical protein [Candidatus Aenigmarchaeota archaeon]
MAERDIEIKVDELVRRSNEIMRRLRALEERDSIIEARLGSVQDAMLRMTEDIRKEFENMDGKMKDFENRLIIANNEIAKIEKNMEKMARKTELTELASLIELYNPLKASFITKEEAERLVEEKLKE